MADEDDDRMAFPNGSLMGPIWRLIPMEMDFRQGGGKCGFQSIGCPVIPCLVGGLFSLDSEEVEENLPLFIGWSISLRGCSSLNRCGCSYIIGDGSDVFLVDQNGTLFQGTSVLKKPV